MFVEERDWQEKSLVCGDVGIDPKLPHELHRIRPVDMISAACSEDPIIVVPVVVKFP